MFDEPTECYLYSIMYGNLNNFFLFATSTYCQCGHVQSVPLENPPTAIRITVESEAEGDAVVWEFSGLSKFQFRLLNYLHFDTEILAYQFYSSLQRNW